MNLQAIRFARRNVDDELDVLKARRYVHAPASLSKEIGAALAEVFGGPRYEQTYAQRLLMSELAGYQHRRYRIFGVKSDSRDALAKRVGFTKKTKGLAAQWNRQSVLSRLLTQPA